MATTQNARSVRLMVPEVGQVSTRAKATDIIFSDGIDLQTKFNNSGLINPTSISGIHAVSPKVEVIVNTDTEFRLRIKSINDTIITPNLKGADANTVTSEIRQMLAELEERVDNLSSVEDISARLNQTTQALEQTNTRLFSLENSLEDTDEEINGIKNRLSDIYTKDEIGNMINDCVTGVEVDDGEIMITRYGSSEPESVQLWYSLSDEDIDSIF